MDGKRTWSLALAATVAVILLLMSTDFSPLATEDFAAMPTSTTRIETITLLSSYQRSAHGYMLTLIDAQGNQLRAYVDFNKIDFLPVNNSYIKAVGTYQPGESPIMFVESIVRLDQGNINNHLAPAHLRVDACTSRSMTPIPYITCAPRSWPQK